VTVPATTAEWLCTRCGSTNRKLVALGTARTVDRCNHCHATHIVEPDDRPVRWRARLED
jgi:NMD protein affecting ribosome stability and mRNA decay